MMLRLNMRLTIDLILLFVLVFASFIQFGYSIDEEVPSDVVSFPRINWRTFWNEYKNLTQWDLEIQRTIWESRKSALKITYSKIFENETHSGMKLTLNFTSVERGNYRLTVVLKKPIIKHIHKIGAFEYVLSYQDCNITFDWSDLKDVSELIFSHGVKWKEKYLNGSEYEVPCFWFRVQRDNVPANYNVILDPSVVGSAGLFGGTFHNPQRKTFYINGYYWGFYSDSTNLVCRTSEDGATWSNPTTVKAGVEKGDWFSIRQYNYGGVEYFYFTYVISETFNNALFFRRDEISGNTLITGTERTAIAAESSTRLNYPDVEVSNTGMIFVGCSRGSNIGSKALRWATSRNANNDGSGTWTMQAFTIEIYQGDLYWASGGFVRLSQSGNVYTAYTGNYITWLRGVLFGGSAWGSYETIKSTQVAYFFGMAIYVNDVFVSYEDVGVDAKLRGKMRTWGVGWGSEELINDDFVFDGGSLCVDDATGDIHCFWGDGDWIYKNKRSSGVWGLATEWVESPTYLLATSINAFPKVVNDKIGVTWTGGIVGVTVYYEVLDLAPPVGEWNLVESWFGDLNTRLWNTVESWYGNLVTRLWTMVELWSGNLITRSWGIVENWFGKIITRSFHTVESWFGILLPSFRFINLIMWIILISCILALIFFLRKKGEV